MKQKHAEHLQLFKALTGRTTIAAPKLNEPTMQYFPSRVKEMWK